MKKSTKKLHLARETVMALEGVSGGDWLTLICNPTGDRCAVSRAFTNCAACETGGTAICGEFTAHGQYTCIPCATVPY
jgi:hypothetical protein